MDSFYKLITGLESLDLGNQRCLDLGADLGSDADDELELGSDTGRDLDVTSDMDLDQEQVDLELLKLQVDASLDSGSEVGADAGFDLGRGLESEIDSSLDNQMSILFDACAVLAGADAKDDRANVCLQVSSELRLDLEVNLSLDSSLDRGLELGGNFGTKTNINVNKATKIRNKKRETMYVSNGSSITMC